MLFLKELLVVLLALAAASSGYKTGTETQGEEEGDRIMGGTLVKDIADYPFMASLLDICGKHICGCTILTPIWLMTSAFCIRDRGTATRPQPLHYWKVIAGVVDIANMKEICSERGQLRFLAAIVVGESRLKLAMLRLTSEFNFGPLVNAVTLPPKGLTWEGKTCKVLGWGWLAFHKNRNTLLFEADLPVISQADCKKNFGNTELQFQFPLLCTRAIGKGVCAGDVGGPLMCDGVQAGIFIFTNSPANCSNPERVEGFVRMDYVLDWIAEVIKKN